MTVNMIHVKGMDLDAISTSMIAKGIFNKLIADQMHDLDPMEIEWLEALLKDVIDAANAAPDVKPLPMSALKVVTEFGKAMRKKKASK